MGLTEFCSSLGDALQTFRMFKTTCMYFGMISMGFSAGVCGPSLVHMEYILHTDTQGVGMSSIGLSIGYLIGAILCGLIFHRINAEIQMSLGFIWIGVTLGSLPFQPNIYWFFAWTTLENIACGFVYSSAQYYILHLWQDHALQKPFIQCIHAFWSLGALTIPFILIPFLPELPEDVPVAGPKNNTAVQNGFSNLTVYSQSHNGELLLNSTDHKNDQDIEKIKGIMSSGDIWLVRYGYIIVGGISIFAGILFFCVFIMSRFQSIRKWDKDDTPQATAIEKEVNGHESIALKPNSGDSSDTEKVKEEKAKEAKDVAILPPSVKYLQYTLLVILFLYTLFLFCQDYVIGLFLSAIAIKGLDWHVTQASILNSVYRGSQGLGRVIGIFVSTIISPAKMLLINMISACLFLFAFIVAVIIIDSDILVWLSVGGIGLALSTTLACIYLWGAQYVTATAAYGGMYFGASSFGSIIGAALGSYLFQHYGYMWIMYNSLGSSILVLLLFLIAAIVGRRIASLRKGATQNHVES